MNRFITFEITLHQIFLQLEKDYSGSAWPCIVLSVTWMAIWKAYLLYLPMSQSWERWFEDRLNVQKVLGKLKCDNETYK